MRSTKKIISVVLSAVMLMSTTASVLTANASTGTLCDKYSTNPNGKVGVSKTITIDGDASDWSEDMMIAKGAAWDVANHYKGGHENCVLDTYALFASWDNDNLYVGWQMVNTTDTWAREGDGPLSDGGRVLDVPLILALSVKNDSVSMSNKNIYDGPIWGKKMGLSFDQHVDHLFYMSGEVGQGTPAMFTAVDAEGNTDYETGCLPFASGGIKYKMAKTNICSDIIGLNFSEDPADVYSNSADWVDYKTFKGSSGTHNTTYDSFYEMSIPLSALGIDKNYIEQNGIGAMIVATRGESGLDCIPFDDTMLDNAKESYTAADDNTSHEKDDDDVITSSFARIGNIGGVVNPTTPVTTTVPSTTTPVATTAPSTTKPVATTVASNNLTVSATSNLFPAKTATLSGAKTVTVNYDLKSVMNLVNGQWTLNYDSSKLKFDESKNPAIMPYITDVITQNDTGEIRGTFTNVNDPYSFASSKRFVQVTFDVIANGSAAVDLDVQTLSVGYKSNGVLNYKNAVKKSEIQDLSKVTGFTTSKLTANTAIVSDQQSTTAVQPTTVAPVSKLDVTASSNIAASATAKASKDKQVTVSYKLTSTMGVVDTQWVVNYDASKLAVADVSMPKFASAVINDNGNGVIKGNFSSSTAKKFTDEDFVTVTFNVIGTGNTNVDLDVEILGLGYKSGSKLNVQYIVDGSQIKNITGVTGFSNASITGKTVVSGVSDVVIGDVTGDGEVSIDDVTAIQTYLVDLRTLTSSQLDAADTDNDGEVTILDATKIQKYIAGYISTLD